eukprot:TRINITY_DN16149_c0_g1_i1.p1 TRINITY_DN16149_c0_g1~~TRINITY_DN16149_c0_g1_i1.p1  ORF type:complete len:680 (+),score=86.56 TRINITY_DN16149_c0_g1_i1:52-2091(+)
MTHSEQPASSPTMASPGDPSSGIRQILRQAEALVAMVQEVLDTETANLMEVQEFNEPTTPPPQIRAPPHKDSSSISSMKLSPRGDGAPEIAGEEDFTPVMPLGVPVPGEICVDGLERQMSPSLRSHSSASSSSGNEESPEDNNHATAEASASVTNLASYRQERRRSRQEALEGAQQIRECAAAGQKDALAQINASSGLAGPTADMVKHTIMMSLATEETQLSQHQVADSLCLRIATSCWFDWVSLWFIAANVIWQCVELEINGALVLYHAHWGIILAENVFCVFFSVELLIRFKTYVSWLEALKDTRFLFDAFLVIMMVFDVWILSPILTITSSQSSLVDKTSVLRVGRILRVMRTARMARVVGSIPELVVLVKGIGVASRSVLFTLLLLMIITYIFAIAFIMLSRGSQLEEVYFKDTLSSMWILVSSIILPDQGPFLTFIGEENWFFGAVILLFTLVSYLTVMNMLTGILVEVVKNVTDTERELREIHFAQKTLTSLIRATAADWNSDQCISRDEFLGLISQPRAIRTLASIGVDVLGCIDLVDVLYEIDRPLPFANLMHHMLMLRGTNTATVKDVVDMRKFIAMEFDQFYDRIDRLEIGVGRQISEEGEPVSPASLTTPRSFLETTASVTDRQLSKSGSKRPSVLNSSFVDPQSMRKINSSMRSSRLSRGSGTMSFK